MLAVDTSLNTSNLKDAAVAFAKLGWPIFPLGVLEREPLREHGREEATTDLGRVEEWWSQSPESNIGLDCGAAGLVVFDVDGREGIDAWGALDPGLPTFEVWSSGNLQVAYGAPKDRIVATGARQLRRGIVVRSEKDYIILPPSVFQNYAEVTWRTMHAPAPLTEALIGRLKWEEREAGRNGGRGRVPLSSSGRPMARGEYMANGVAAMRAETDGVRAARPEMRRETLHGAASTLGGLVKSNLLSYIDVQDALLTAALESGMAEPEARRTISEGLRAALLGVETVAVGGAGERKGEGAQQPGVSSPESGPGADLATPGAVETPAAVPPADRELAEYDVRKGRMVRQRITYHGLVRTKLSNFTACIDEELVLDDGEHSKRLLTISGRTASGRELPPARVEQEEFNRMGWVTKHWGMRTIIKAGQRDQLRAAIQELSPDTSPNYIYTHTGWRRLEGQHVYLTMGGAIGGQARVQVELEPELQRYRFETPPAPGSDALREAMQASLRFLDVAPPAVSLPLWSAQFLAPLSEIMPPAFALWLYGATGSLKTTLAALALNHFGDWTKDNLLMWSSTSNALEKYLFLAKDAPFVIDDFSAQAGRDAAEKLETVAGLIVRSAGNRSAKARMSGDTSLRPVYRPRGLTISTGEQLPEGQSILARLVTVEVRRAEIAMAALNRAQAERNSYAQAMAGYIAWLAGQLDTLRESLPVETNRLRDLALVEGQHLRLPEALAALFAGYDLGLRFAVECGALEAGRADRMRAEGWSTLMGLGHRHAEISAGERPLLRYLTILNELLTQGKLRLATMPKGGTAHKSERADDEGERAERRVDEGELIGWRDEEYLYLLPSAAYRCVVQFAREDGRHFGVKELALRKALAEEGLLEGSDGHYTVPKRINGELQRVVQLRRSAVEKLWRGAGDG